MAVGKTALSKHILAVHSDIYVSLEDNSSAVNKVQLLGLDKFKEQDFYQIQRIFIDAEIKRYELLRKRYPKVLLDLGPEEIEFYTLFFPQAIGANWDVYGNLQSDLEALRRCKLDCILYLDAKKELLYDRKAKDSTRTRGFFDFYIEKLHSSKLQWFRSKENVRFINVTGLSMEQLEKETLRILDQVEQGPSVTASRKQLQ